MDGALFARKVEKELAERGISKGEFYAAVGISATAMYGWRKGAEPKRESVDAIEKYFGISFSDDEKSDPREDLRDDLRILLHSASDLPPSSVYALISQIEKMKEDAT